MNWTRTEAGTPVNRLGGRSDPLYKPGHTVYLNNGNGIVEMTVKGRWLYLKESNTFIRHSAYFEALRHSGPGTDPALTDPTLRELGKNIRGQTAIGFYELMENDAKVPWFTLNPSWEGASKYTPVFEEA